MRPAPVQLGFPAKCRLFSSLAYNQKRGSKVLRSTGWGRYSRSLALRIAACAATIGCIPLAATPAPRLYTVEHYDVVLQSDLSRQRLTGQATVRIHSLSDEPVAALELDAGSLEISSVEEGKIAQWFERKGETLVVALANPLYPSEIRSLTVRYQAGPSAGLAFFPDQVYGSDASAWMPCNDRPGERATLSLSLAAPADFRSAASGRLLATRSAGGQSVADWQLDSPAAPAFYGFALGTFPEESSTAAGVRLRVLGAGAEVFEPTTAAIRYLVGRTGKPYPGPAYTQVFVHGDATRSLAGGLALLPETCAQGLSKEPEKLWLLSRMLADQWYGIGIAVKDWSDLWLSEGVPAFVADAFLGQRLGAEAYEKGIARSRQIYDGLRAAGKDRSLNYIEWTTRQDAGGEIPLHKGVCFLYLLHELVGDSAFWQRLRVYTAAEWGQAAASQDLQNAFAGAVPEQRKAGKRGGKERGNANAKNLAGLFDLWVYGIPPDTSGSKKSRR